VAASRRHRFQSQRDTEMIIHLRKCMHANAFRTSEANSPSLLGKREQVLSACHHCADYFGTIAQSLVWPYTVVSGRRSAGANIDLH